MKTSPFQFLPLVLMVLNLGSGLVAHGDTGLHGTVVDSKTGLPVPCTVTILDSHGQVLTHHDSLRDGFRCQGSFSETLPEGQTTIRVSRGFEYRAVETTVELKPNTPGTVHLALERVVDLRKRGWFAGDSHVHMIHGERTVPVTFADVALAAQAEDLHYLSVGHDWAMDDPTPETLQAQLQQLSTPDCFLTWNLEAPKNYYRGDAGRCLGHCWSLAVRGRTVDGLNVIPLLLAASAGDYQSTQPQHANFESHQLIRDQGGAVFYTHPLRWWTGPWGGQGGYPRQQQMRISNMAVELPLDVILGPTFDGLDILTGAREHGANAKAFQLWVLLLNHGYRLAATGSSDACFDRPGGAVPGVPRTYTYLPDGFSWEGLARATAAGRTFVSTGPLLLAFIDDQPPGTTFSIEEGHRTLSIQAWASGNDDQGLRRIEVLRNGQLHRNFTLDPGTRAWRSNLLISSSTSSWFCVRARGGNEQSQQAVTGAFFFQSQNNRAPAPSQARVTAKILDAETGMPIAGTLTEVQYLGPRPADVRPHPMSSPNHTLSIRGTLRLRAESPGYHPLTLSPFLDYPPLRAFITGLRDDDLLEWATYENVRELLSNVQLTFRLKRAQSSRPSEEGAR